MSSVASKHLRPTYWCGTLPKNDPWGEVYGEFMYDGRMRNHAGTWTNFSQESWKRYGCGILRIGFGQKYQRQEDGRYLLIEGDF
jgi:hypothetical protein